MRLFLLATLLIFVSCESLDIQVFFPKESPQLAQKSLKADLLTKSQKLSLRGNFGPEDILVDPSGKYLYTGVHEGSFKYGQLMRYSTDGKSSSLIHQARNWITGLEWAGDGKIAALFLNRGLVAIDPHTGASKVLVGEIEGKKIKIPNDVAVGKSGKIYFTVTSFEDDFSMNNALKIVLEQKDKGGVFMYDPKTKKVTRLAQGGVFLNGIEISEDESFLLLVETGKYRVHKLDLHAENKKSVLIDNLEGIPNGISKSSDGTFWIGFSSNRNSDLDMLHRYPWFKTLVFNLPDSMRPVLKPFGMVLRIDKYGNIIERLYDKKGKVVKEATSVVEANNKLYFGGDRSGYIPYLNLLEVYEERGQNKEQDT